MVHNMGVARRQTLVQLTDEIVSELDELAARDKRSRSELIRQAIEELLHAEREREYDRQIVEGYTRLPTTEEEMRWAEDNTRRLLDEEDGW